MPTNFELERLKPKLDIFKIHENRVHELTDSNVTHFKRTNLKFAILPDSPCHVMWLLSGRARRAIQILRAVMTNGKSLKYRIIGRHVRVLIVQLMQLSCFIVRASAVTCASCTVVNIFIQRSAIKYCTVSAARAHHLSF